MSTQKSQQVEPLSTGSNELEIVEFCIGNEFFGINVLKVREIIRIVDEIVPIPDAHVSIIGVINLRGNIIPVVDLAKHLSIKTDYDERSCRIVVSEFNKIQVGFMVSQVTRLYRFSWKNVEVPSGLLQSKAGYAIGIVQIEDRINFLLDFEKIASDINPDVHITPQTKKLAESKPPAEGFDRAKKQVLIVEDSALMRELLEENVKASGYNTTCVNNGKEGLELLEEKVKEGNVFFDIIISDIEMPLMDGLTMVKKVKEHSGLGHLPCIMFSSMISPEMEVKIKTIGADGAVTKPEIGGLVELMDANIKKRQGLI